MNDEDNEDGNEDGCETCMVYVDVYVCTWIEVGWVNKQHMKMRWRHDVMRCI